MGGRTLSIYEECFKEKKLNNTQVHNTFLDALEELLPEGCQPIIMSDAIYKTQWFKTIESKGWYWVGRVRGNVQMSLDGVKFQGCSSIMKQATAQPKSIGTVLFSKATQFPCAGVLFHGAEKGRHQKKKRGGNSKGGKSLYYSKKAKQPWLLISHLPETCNTPRKVVKLYRLRMQIEEGFRDTKSLQYGLGLAQAKSKTVERYNNLLPVASLTLFVLWCIGQVAVEQKYHYKLQANTIRHRAVLSNIYLAMQIINDWRYKIDEKRFKIIFSTIAEFSKKIGEVT